MQVSTGVTGDPDIEHFQYVIVGKELSDAIPYVMRRGDEHLSSTEIRRISLLLTALTV